METVQIAMMGALLAMVAGVLLKMVDLSGRVGRVEAMLGMWLRHTPDRDTGLPVAAMSPEADQRGRPSASAPA